MSDVPISSHPDDRRRAHPPATARDAMRCMLLVLAVLVAFGGDSVHHAAADAPAGVRRDVLSAVASPAGWVADHLPFAAAADQVAGWFSPDAGVGGSADGSFHTSAGSGTARVAPQAFDGALVGAAQQPRVLRSLRVTGDSMSQPLDAQLARDLAGDGVRTTRDVHLGSGISKPFLVDWGKLAEQQARTKQPDATVVFLGANEGFPMRGPGGEVRCCGAAWAAEYATRVRAMMDAYRRGGAGRVYWILLPAPQDAGRARVARTVNAAVRVAAGAFGAQVAVVDAAALFTPGGRYRSAMPVGDRHRIVRRPDGIHLNDEGARLLATAVEGDVKAAFATGAG